MTVIITPALEYHVYSRTDGLDEQCNLTPRQTQTSRHCEKKNVHVYIRKGTVSEYKKCEKSRTNPSSAVLQTDMDRAATQHAAISKTATKQTYTHKCGRCRTVLEYDTHADWPTISLLVNEHYLACPVKLDFRGPAPPHPPSEPDDTQDALSPLHDSNENMGATDGRHDEPFIAGFNKQRKSEAQRKRELEDDEYTYSVRPASVRCRGCNREISLDKRSRYYPGLWTKHRGKCARIQKIEVS